MPNTTHTTTDQLWDAFFAALRKYQYEEASQISKRIRARRNKQLVRVRTNKVRT